MADHGPAFRAVLGAVRAGLSDLDPTQTVVVACSGGADSLALAAAAATVARSGGPAGAAVVVDHGLQPDSAVVAGRAAEQCRRLGLDPVLVRRVTVGGPGGPEAAARRARYTALDAVAQELGASAVLLGHTADDQAEGVLLGLARGSGARSLSGMPARRGLLRRPLLAITRAQTEQACAAAGLEAWQDPTNLRPVPASAPPDVRPAGALPPGVPPTSVPPSGPAWTDPAWTGADGTGRGAAGPAPSPVARDAGGLAPLRSRVRAEVLPVLERVLGPGVAGALVRTAELLREDDEALRVLAGELLTAARRAAGEDVGVEAVAAEAAGRDAAGEDVGVEAVPAEAAAAGGAEGGQDAAGVVLRLDVPTLAAALPAVRRRALRRAAIEAGSPPGALARSHVLAVDRLVTHWSGQRPVDLPGGVSAGRRGRLLALWGPGPGAVPEAG